MVAREESRRATGHGPASNMKKTPRIYLGVICGFYPGLQLSPGKDKTLKSILGKVSESYRAWICLQHMQNSLGDFSGGVLLFAKFSCLQGRLKYSELHGRGPGQLLGMDLPQHTQCSSGRYLRKTWDCFLGLQLSPEETKVLLEMPGRNPRELPDMDLCSTYKMFFR